MRVSELAREAGVPLSAVKYYQREGLLPPGDRTATNRVSYGAPHVQRIRLVRALLETGGLTVAATKDVIAALDADRAPLADTFAVAQHAMSTPRTREAPPSPAARARVQALAAAHGWRVTDDNPGFDTAARALDGLHAIAFDVPDDYLTAYAAAAAAAATADLHALTGRRDRDAVAELMVVGSVLGDPLFAGLRRLAQQHATHGLFPTDRAHPTTDQERDAP